MAFEEAKPQRPPARILIAGESGTGKTHLSLTFPNPYIIDTEQGSLRFAGRTFKNGEEEGIFKFKAMQSVSLAEIIGAITQLSAKPPGDMGTLIIDKASALWEMCQDAYFTNLQKKIDANAIKRVSAEPQFNDWKEVKRPWKKMVRMLKGLPCHVIFTSRVDEEYKMDGGKPFVVADEKISVEKHLPEEVDLTVITYSDPFRIKIQKDRAGIWPSGKIIENPSWSIFEQYYEIGAVNIPPEETPEEDEKLFNGKEEIKFDIKDNKSLLLTRIKNAQKEYTKIGKEAEFNTLVAEYTKASPGREEDLKKWAFLELNDFFSLVTIKYNELKEGANE